MASNKLGDYKVTINKCTEVTYIDDKNPKSYYLRAQAHSKLKDFDQALTDIKEAIKLNPADKNLRDEFEAIKAAKKKESGRREDPGSIFVFPSIAVQMLMQTNSNSLGVALQ